MLPPGPTPPASMKEELCGFSIEELEKLLGDEDAFQAYLKAWVAKLPVSCILAIPLVFQICSHDIDWPRKIWGASICVCPRKSCTLKHVHTLKGPRPVSVHLLQLQSPNDGLFPVSI